MAARAPPRATNVVDAPAANLRVFALRRPKPAGHRLVNVTSTSAEWRQLSPFNLGPVEVHTPRGVFVATNVENAWQFSKVYPCDLQGRTFVDADGAPNDHWYAWARAGWARRDAVRFPMGRGARPLYSLGVNYVAADVVATPQLMRLPYIEARRQLYAPWYAAAVISTSAYAELAALYASAQLPNAQPIGLVDFDGWDHVGQGYSLAEALAAPRPKFGHAFVLAGLLTGDRCWET